MVVADDDTEASEWCQMVFQGDMEPTPMANCGDDNSNGDNSNYGNNRYYNNNGARGLQQYDNSGQSYALSQDYIEDGYSVCQALNGFGGQGEHLYDKSGSGSMYKYTGSGSSSNQQQQASFGYWEKQLDEETDTVVQQKSSFNNSKMGSAIGLFFVGVAGAAMVVGAILLVKKRKTDEKKEPMLQMEEDKQGAMA